MSGRTDCEVCGADATTSRTDEHNGPQPLCAWDAYQHDVDRWAREQGLAEPAEQLAAAGIVHSWEHVGGNVVVLYVTAGTRHVVRITMDGSGDEPYLLGLYPVDDGDAEPVDGYRSCALADIADVTAELVDLAEQTEDADTARAVWPAPNPAAALTFDECDAAGVDGTLR